MTRCQEILQSGLRKGRVCDNLCKDDATICQYHQRKIEQAKYQEERKKEEARWRKEQDKRQKEYEEQVKQRELKIQEAPQADPDSYHQELGLFVGEMVTELTEARREIQELENRLDEERCTCRSRSYY